MRRVDAYRRHDWVVLADDWRRKLAAPLAKADEEVVARWTTQGRPLVVARRCESDGPEALRLGLALPGKRRVSLVLPMSAVSPPRRPPLFRDVVDIGAAIWPEPIGELAGMIAAIAPNARVFGSFAWQFFAADPADVYVTQNSDIDLLLTPTHADQLSATLALLRKFESRWPAPRLDGEIALPGGAFVSWREFAARPSKILVKDADHVSLRPIEHIDALLAARAA